MSGLATATDAVQTAEWDELARRSGNLFATPEWIRAWCAHARVAPELTLLRDGGGDPWGLLALCERDGVVRLVGHGQGDELGPVCAPANRPRAAAALREAIGDRPFRLDDLPADFDWAAALGGRVIRRTASPELRWAPGTTWESWLGNRGPRFRRNARRAGRSLTHRLADDPASLDDDLDALFALHEDRWGASAAEFAGRSRALHRAFAHVALERDWLRLHVLEDGGRPVAALLAFRYGGTEWPYQSGWDAGFARESPGLALHCRAIAGAMTDGCGGYRFLRGGEAYKAGFTTHDRGLVTVARP